MTHPDRRPDQPAEGQRVYAPASERVPVEPVPGHRDFVEHPDQNTPEREMVGGAPGPEPAFTRVARPSTQMSGGDAATMSDTAYQNSYAEGTMREPWMSGRGKMFFGIGFSWFTVLCSGVGVWLFWRWRRERNKPINRLRRQARQAASEIRGRVSELPTAPDAARPAMGLTTAAVSIMLILWQQAQARSRRAEKVVSDVDWQKRLQNLKQRWTPLRVELEKTSISRHK
jgi:hypothetical protein